MKRNYVAVIFICCLGFGSLAASEAFLNDNRDNAGAQSSNSTGSASTQSSVNADGLESGVILRAELSKSLDAKKAKPGDEVTAKVTQDVMANGRVMVRKGSKLIGHVTEAQARTKDNPESHLGIAFDRAVLKNGQQMTLNASLQALAAAPHVASPVSDEGPGLGPPAGAPEPASGRPGVGVGGVMGGATSTVGS